MAAQDLDLRLRISADGQVAVNELNAIDRSLDGVSGSADRAATSLQDTTNALLSGAVLTQVADAVRGYAAELINTADAYKTLESRVGLLNETQAETEQVMGELQRIATATHQPLETTGDLYVRLGNALKDSGANAAEVLGMTEALNNALRVSGASGQEATGALTQLGQALASGALRGDEFNSVNEQMPVLMDAVAQSMGVTRGELRGLAEQGQITADIVRQAVSDMASTWEEQAASMPITLEAALNDLGTAWQSYVGQSDSVETATNALTSALGGLADNLDHVAGVVGTISMGALAAGVVKASQAFGAYNATLAANRTALEQQRASEALALQQASAATNATAARTAALARQALQVKATAEAELLAANQAVAAATAQRNAAQGGMERLAAEERLIAALQARSAADARATAAAQATTAAQRTAATAAQVNATAQTAAANAANLTAGATAGLGAAVRSLATPMGAINAAMATMIGYQVGDWMRDAAASAEAWYNPLTAVRAGLEGLDSALQAISPVYREQIEAEGRLAETQQRTAEKLKAISEQTGVTITSMEGLNAAVKDGTIVFNEATSRWEAGAVSMQKAADASSLLDAALQNQAAALEELRNKQDAEHQTAIARLETAADLAKAYGDEAEALRLAAEARTLALEAAQQAQQIAQAELESAQARLANLQAEAQAQGTITAAMREQLDAARVLVEEKRQAVAESQAAAQAADAEARAAKLAADTYGDQSEQLDELTASYQRLQVEADKNANAIESGADAAERLAGAQKDAAEKAAAYADALKRGADDAGRYAQASREANEQVALLTDTIKKGESAQAKDAALKRDLAEAAAKMQDALDDATAAIDRQIASMERDNDIAQAKIDLQIKQLEREQALAEAKGDTARAAEIALDIARLEVDAANQSAQALYAQAEALAQKADMAERAAQADGILTDEERDMIDALRDAAEMAKIEAQSMDVSTQSKEDNAKAAKKAADASRDQADAARDNAKAQEEEKAAIDEKNAAKSDSEDSGSGSGQTWTDVNDPQSLAQQFNPETNPGVNVGQALKDYLYSWTDGGAGSSEYVGNILNEVKEIWEQERKGREESASAASASADAAKSSADIAQAFADIYGTGPLASQASADTNATSSASTSAQPVSIDTRSIEASITSALQNMSVAPASAGSTININIEGILDINDSATLDSLARKLQPIFADLERRGL